MRWLLKMRRTRIEPNLLRALAVDCRKRLFSCCSCKHVANGARVFFKSAIFQTLAHYSMFLERRLAANARAPTMDSMQIVLADERAVFVGGSLVQGTCHVRLRDTIRARCVVLQLVGKAHARWTESEQHTGFVGGLGGSSKGGAL